MREKLIELLERAFESFIDDPYCMPDEREFADHLIANGVTFATDTNVGDKWISVKDRLPSANEDIIIVVDSEYPHRLPRVVRKKALSEEEFWGVSIGFFAHGVRFTHWMPLPEPPKGE